MILKVDVDSSRKLSRAELQRRARIAHVTIIRVVDRRSPSGRGWHRWIEIERLGENEVGNGRTKEIEHRASMPCNSDPGASSKVAVTTVTVGKGSIPSLPFSLFEIVALQLLFGSDPIREAFNLHRARLVQAGQVPRFWARRWNTLYATSGGR